mmetsp:Transcript_79490/g.257454  ORF Transcript_79490/g.257454 Transcript_79490/m.257454 type:complete len:310 (+) Transcript_79490:703-1632(+)
MGDTGPEDGAERHQVWVRGAVDVAALQAVRLQAVARRADAVDLGCGRGVARLQHGVVRIGDDCAVADDDATKRLALFGKTHLGSPLGGLDGQLHELLMLLARGLAVLGRHRILRPLLADEYLLVGVVQGLSVLAAKPPPQGLVHRRVHEKGLDLLHREAVDDLDHVLGRPLFSLLQVPRGVSDVAATTQAIASRLALNLVVEDLVVEAVLRGRVPVHADVHTAEARPLHGAPAHGARLASRVELTVGEIVAANGLARLLDRVHFRVPRGVLTMQHHVVSARNDDAAPHDCRAEGPTVLKSHAGQRRASR